MEPIRPKERGGMYAAWIQGHEREADARNVEYLHWPCSPRQVAQEFADDVADHGRYPGLINKPFVVMVRDKRTLVLTAVTINWENEPMPFVSGEEHVESHRGGVRYA